MDPEGLERKNLQNLLDTIGRRVRWDYLNPRPQNYYMALL
jgi:hypothetical protein